MIEKVQESVAVLTQHKFGCAVGCFTRDSVELTSPSDEFVWSMNKAMYRLHCFVLTEEHADAQHTMKCSYPSSWWQAFKRDVLPRWVSRCLGSVILTVDTQVARLTFSSYYPEASLVVPEASYGRTRRRMVCRVESNDSEEIG